MFTPKITLLFAIIIGACLCNPTHNEDTMKFLDFEETAFPNFNLNFSYQDAELFVKGYFKGLEIFDNLLSNSTCLQNAEVVFNDALKLYEILKDFKFDTTAIKNIKELFVITKSLIVSFYKDTKECKNFAYQAMNDIHRVIDRVKKEDYLKELGVNLVFNMSKIKDYLDTGFASFHQRQMESAGVSLGKATKLIALWDL